MAEEKTHTSRPWPVTGALLGYGLFAAVQAFVLAIHSFGLLQALLATQRPRLLDVAYLILAPLLIAASAIFIVGILRRRIWARWSVELFWVLLILMLSGNSLVSVVRALPLVSSVDAYETGYFFGTLLFSLVMLALLAFLGRATLFNGRVRAHFAAVEPSTAETRV